MSELYVPSLTHPRVIAKHAEVTKTLGGTEPEKLTTASRLFVAASFTGNQGNNTANADDIYLGWNSTNQPILIPSGSTVLVEADKNGMPNDLEKIWLRGSSGDGVVVNFIEGTSV